MKAWLVLVLAFALSILAGVITAAVWVAGLHVTALPPALPR